MRNQVIWLERSTILVWLIKLTIIKINQVLSLIYLQMMLFKLIRINFNLFDYLQVQLSVQG